MVRMIPNPFHFKPAVLCPAGSDQNLVLEARSLLGLLDFEFFRTAWRNWYREEPDDRRIEPGFMRFLLNQQAPNYVRHFARLVLERAASGRLDLSAFGLEAQDRHVEPVETLKDDFASSSLLVVLGLLLIIAF
jgi:hypothetical protein